MSNDNIIMYIVGKYNPAKDIGKDVYVLQEPSLDGFGVCTLDSADAAVSSIVSIVGPSGSPHQVFVRRPY